MRRFGPVSRLGQSTHLDICRLCSQRLRFSQCRQISSSFQRSDQVPFLERTRRRIWGTDSPPGADDPYTGLSKSSHQRLSRDESNFDEDMSLEEFEALARREEKEMFQKSIDDAPQHADYTPVDNWEGLEIVGGEIEWKEGRTFQGFSPVKQQLSIQDIKVAAHRALVEVLTAYEARLSIPSGQSTVFDSYLTSKVRVACPRNGQGYTLTWPDRSTKQRVLDGLTETTMEGSQYDAQSYLNECDSAWLGLSLDDAQFKLAVVRRFFQLTGHRISDATISRVLTLSELVEAVHSQASKPNNLFEKVTTRRVLAALPNVKFTDRRVTPIDQEKSKGRWKVIEKELASRELPLMGHN